MVAEAVVLVLIVLEAMASLSAGRYDGAGGCCPYTLLWRHF